MEILASKQCGCVFCRSIFDAREIGDWTNESADLTALCPHCGMPAVLPEASGFPLKKEELKKINLYAYGPDYMAEHPEAIRLYCSRYLSGEVTHKKSNEDIFVHYLTMLSDKGDAWALALLGYFYQTGGEYHEANLDKAVEILSNPLLFDDEVSLSRLGSIYIDGYEGEEGKKKGFELLSKAMALGSDEAVFFFAKCYFEGFYVKKDAEFAFSVVYRKFEDIFDRYRRNQADVPMFIEFAFQIGRCCEEGEGTRQDKLRALRYFLLADLGIRNYDRLEHNHEFEQAVKEKINALANELGFSEREPLYDQDSFFDSFAEQQDAESEKKILAHQYDREEQTLKMVIDFSEPEIFVDLASLYCEVISGRTEWEFRDIVGGKVSQEPAPYRFVHYAGDSGWAFLESAEQEDPAAFLRFKELDDKPQEGK